MNENDPEVVECIKDGRVVVRLLDYVVIQQGRPTRRMPVLLEGEVLRWVYGSNRPIILQEPRRA